MDNATPCSVSRVCYCYDDNDPPTPEDVSPTDKIDNLRAVSSTAKQQWICKSLADGTVAGRGKGWGNEEFDINRNCWGANSVDVVSNTDLQGFHTSFNLIPVKKAAVPSTTSYLLKEPKFRGYFPGIDALKKSQATMLATVRGRHLFVATSGFEAAVSCTALYQQGVTRNGYYFIQPDPSTSKFKVFCNMEQGGGWTVIAARGHFELAPYAQRTSLAFSYAASNSQINALRRVSTEAKQRVICSSIRAKARSVGSLVYRDWEGDLHALTGCEGFPRMDVSQIPINKPSTAAAPFLTNTLTFCILPETPTVKV